MDSNKDEAARCLRLAHSALAAGDTPLFLRLLRLARRLNPTIPLPSDRSSDTLIQQIISHTDYYAILGLPHSCSAADIRRQYRKLSLLVHPDKSPHPDAQSAFISLSTAFHCLIDSSSRHLYDQKTTYKLPDNDTPVRRPRRRRYYDYDDSDMRVSAQRVHRPRSPPVMQPISINFIVLVHMAVILVIVLLACVPSEGEYLLKRRGEYRVGRRTEEYGVEYFVKEGFDERYPEGSVGREEVEKGVVRSYKGLLMQLCQREMARRRWVRDLEMESCDKLRRIQV